VTHDSSVPLYWRLQGPRYTLTGTRCIKCDSRFFPPKNFCPNCRRKGKVERFKFSGNGRIISYTVIRIPPEGFESYTPYAVALIELDEGAIISGQIVGNINDVDIGKRVKTVFRKVYEDGSAGLIHYGLKFILQNNE
jgi:uncharacterized OB-fold protein